MTDDQLIDKLRTVVREEVETETKKTESDTLFSNVRVINLVKDLKNSVKDLKISNSRLEKGQEELKKDVGGLKKDVGGLKKDVGGLKTEQKAQGVTLKKLTTLANKTNKSVNLMAGNFDEDIVSNERRIDRIEDHLGLPSFKTKQ